MSEGRAIVEATMKHEKGGISFTKMHTYLLVSELPSLYQAYAYYLTGEIMCILCEDFEI